MSTKISQIYLLVHPDDMLFHLKADEIHSIYLHMHTEWENLVRKIADNHESILVEFDGHHLTKYIENKDERHLPENNVRELALQIRGERIGLYNQLLGNRYLRFGKTKPYEHDWNEILDGRGLELDSKVQIFSFGEFYEKCVKIWGDEFFHVLIDRVGVEADLKTIYQLCVDLNDMLQISEDINSIKDENELGFD